MIVKARDNYTGKCKVWAEHPYTTCLALFNSKIVSIKIEIEMTLLYIRFALHTWPYVNDVEVVKLQRKILNYFSASASAYAFAALCLVWFLVGKNIL